MPRGVARVGDSVNLRISMRVVVTALALSAVSFIAGVAGDLSVAAPPPRPSAVVQLPPPLPADAPRAHPLPPLRHAAEARPLRRHAQEREAAWSAPEASMSAEKEALLAKTGRLAFQVGESFAG